VLVLNFKSNKALLQSGAFVFCSARNTRNTSKHFSTPKTPKKAPKTTILEPKITQNLPKNSHFSPQKHQKTPVFRIISA